MSQSLRARPRLAATILLGSAFLLAACQGSTTPSSAPASVGGVPSAAASTAPSIVVPTEGPTPFALMPIELLPQASIDPSTVDLVCDEDAALSCDDAVQLAARMAITIAGSSPVEQVLVDRTDPAAVQITFWAIDAESTELTAYTATVDTAAGTIVFPAENPDATFPPS